MKYNFLLVIALLFIYASSCNDDKDYEPFDHAAQAIIDNDSLVKYMQAHYVDAEGELQLITDNQTPVYDQVQVKTVVHHWDEIDEDVSYNLYYLIQEEGINERPVKVDSVHVSYKGLFLGYVADDERLDLTEFETNNYGNWSYLFTYIEAWKEAIPLFKSGDVNVLPDMSFEYTNSGKGIIFAPSGLAYFNTVRGPIPANSPLIFYIKLNMVKHTDADNDSILSMFEDLDNDGDFLNDDTDDDGKANMVDNDDDGDEILTIDENPDPNGDGNPEDALDSDGDGIPDYLDSDS